MLQIVEHAQRPLTERFRRRWGHRFRVAEAMVLFVAAALAQRWVPMPRWSSVLGEPGAVPRSWQGQAVVKLPARAATSAELRTVRALQAARRIVPWSPKCLVEATAAQVLLRQQGSSGVVVIGLRRPDDDCGDWGAHAWLVGATGALSGGPAAAGFTATTVFEVPGGLRAEAVNLDPNAAHRS